MFQKRPFSKSLSCCRYKVVLYDRDRADHWSCGSKRGDRYPKKGDTSGATARVGRIWLNAGGRRARDERRPF